MRATWHPSFWCILAATLALSIAAYYGLLLQQNPFTWDEADHAYRSSVIARHLRDLNLRDLFVYSARQTWYPFFPTWVYGLPLALFGHSMTVARATTLVLFSASVLICYLFAARLPSKRPWIVGTAASALLLLSPMHWLFAVQTMLEVLGLLLWLLALWVYIEAVRRNNLGLYLLTGLIAAFLFFTKYGLAILFLPGLGTTFFTVLMLRDFGFKRSTILRNHLLLFSLMAGVLFLWVLLPTEVAAEKIRTVLTTTFRYRIVGEISPFFHTSTLGFSEAVLFYPRVLLTYYALSPWITVGLLVGFIAAFKLFSQFEIRAVLLSFLVAYSILSLGRLNMQPRYIYPIVPLLFIVGAVWVDRLLAMNFSSWPLKYVVFGIGAILVILFIGDAFSVPSSLKSMANYAHRGFFYNADSSKMASPLFFGLIPRPSFTLPLLPEGNAYNPNAAYPPPGSTTNTVSFLEFIEQNTSKDQMRCILGQWQEFPYGLVYWHFRDEMWRSVKLQLGDDCQYLITFHVSDTSPFFMGFYRYSMQESVEGYARQVAQDPRYALKTSKDFTDLGVTVKIYEAQ